MSFPLTKLITSGVLGLNTSGLALYFGPQLLNESSEAAIYNTLDKSSKLHQDRKLSRFVDREKELHEKLKEELSNFMKALQQLGKSKSKENSNILQTFSEVEKTEQELKQLYETNKSILSEISEINEKENEAAAKKLKAEETVKKLEFYIKSLQSVSATMYNWGESVSNFICLIEEKEAGKCKSKNKRWFETQTQSSQEESGNTNGGGRRFNSGRRFESSSSTVTGVKEKVRGRIKKS